MAKSVSKRVTLLAPYSMWSFAQKIQIPPTVVGGLFKFLSEKDLKYPPTAVGGIKNLLQKRSVETI